MNTNDHNNNELKQKETDSFLASMNVSSGSGISHKLFTEIREKIVNGELPPGYVFPNELVLCEKLKIGRSSLREAFHALSAIGLITRTKHGTYVNKKVDYVGATPFGEFLKKSDINDLLEFRIMLESEIVALAAQRATEEDIELLSRYHDAMKNSADEIIEITKYDTLFHIQLGVASHNKLFEETMLVVRNIYETMIYQIFSSDSEMIKNAMTFHEKILRAVTQHDAKKARKASYEHIMSVKNAVSNERDLADV